MMIPRLRSLVARRRAAGSSDEIQNLRKTLERRRLISAKLVAFAPYLRTLLVIAGLLYTLALPHQLLGRGHYIDENALQPGQVSRGDPGAHFKPIWLTKPPGASPRSTRTGTGPTFTLPTVTLTAPPTGTSFPSTGARHKGRSGDETSAHISAPPAAGLAQSKTLSRTSACRLRSRTTILTSLQLLCVMCNTSNRQVSRDFRPRSLRTSSPLECLREQRLRGPCSAENGRSRSDRPERIVAQPRSRTRRDSADEHPGRVALVGHCKLLQEYARPSLARDKREADQNDLAQSTRCGQRISSL